MYAAARRGDLELVRFHVGQGVDVDFAHPEFQSTALVTALLAGHADVATLLLDSGASPVLRSVFDECTPLEAALQRSGDPGMAEVATRLRAAGATLS